MRALAGIRVLANDPVLLAGRAVVFRGEGVEEAPQNWLPWNYRRTLDSAATAYTAAH